MSVSFMYVAWLNAVRDLEEALELKPKQKETLREWFRANIFEIGCENVITLGSIRRERDPNSIREMADEHARHRLVETLFKKGMYMRSERPIHRPGYYPNEHDISVTTRVLIVAPGKFTGPGERIEFW